MLQKVFNSRVSYSYCSYWSSKELESLRFFARTFTGHRKLLKCIWCLKIFLRLAFVVRKRTPLSNQSVYFYHLLTSIKAGRYRPILYSVMYLSVKQKLCYFSELAVYSSVVRTSVFGRRTILPCARSMVDK